MVLFVLTVLKVYLGNYRIDKVHFIALFDHCSPMEITISLSSLNSTTANYNIRDRKIEGTMRVTKSKFRHVRDISRYTLYMIYS